MRLNKYLAKAGIASRRKSDELIRQGKITVNGVVITALGYSIDENTDEVKYNGKILSLSEPPVYILLNKPAGYVTTVKDGWGRNVVTDLIPDMHRIFPVGRLDKDTEGLLLLTNDGNICYRLTHPKFEVEKVYQVTLNKELIAEDKMKIESGVMLESGVTAPCEIRLPKNVSTSTIVNISIHEGKKRQVREMFKALGYRVIRLVRIKFANLTTENLPVGKWRYLTNKEIEHLTQISTDVSV
ncbi:pseudouridine synthase [candidate division KSB1 bacterium]|nr:pseudouridine synthase [candidate division KSB1 bacterium]